MSEDDNKRNDSIAQVFDLEPLEPQEHEVQEKPEDYTKDYEYARNNLIDLIEEGTKAFKEISDIAQQSESARAFEVSATYFKSLVDANKDLLELAKKRKELQPEKLKEPGKTTNNNLFVGSTSELLQMMKDNKKINE